MSDIINGATYASPESWDKVTQILNEHRKALIPMTVDELISGTYFGKFLAGHEVSFSEMNAGYEITIFPNRVAVIMGTRTNEFKVTNWEGSVNLSEDSRYIEFEENIDGDVISTIYVYLVEEVV